MIIAEGNNKFVNDINLAICIFAPALCSNKQLGDYMNEYISSMPTGLYGYQIRLIFILLRI